MRVSNFFGQPIKTSAAVDGKHYATYTVQCSLVPVGSGVTHGGHIVCYVVVTKVASKVSLFESTVLFTENL